MGLDRWQMEPDVEDCFTEESGGPIPDYVALPATPTLAGIAKKGPDTFSSVIRKCIRPLLFALNKQ